MRRVSAFSPLCPALPHAILGTAAGDPAEANWVGEGFQREDELLIGSVKGNVG